LITSIYEDTWNEDWKEIKEEKASSSYVSV